MNKPGLIYKPTINVFQLLDFKAFDDNDNDSDYI